MAEMSSSTCRLLSLSRSMARLSSWSSIPASVSRVMVTLVPPPLAGASPSPPHRACARRRGFLGCGRGLGQLAKALAYLVRRGVRGQVEHGERRAPLRRPDALPELLELPLSPLPLLLPLAVALVELGIHLVRK